MSQQTHFTARAAPADIAAGRAAGRYLAQVRGHPLAVTLIAEYATAAVAPADGGAWYQAGPGDSFIFSAGPGCDPTWVRLAPGATERIGATEAVLAVALVTA